MRYLLPVALASLVACPHAFTQNGGDDCAGPTAISGSGSWAFDTSSATSSGFSPCGPPFNNDQFWVWTALQAGDYLIDTCGSNFDTRVAWYAGVDCAAACGADNDDACGLQSVVGLPGVNAGDSFLIHVGAFGAGGGAGSLNIDFDPCFLSSDDALEDNDSCLTAAPLAPGQYSGLFARLTDADFFAVTVQPGEILEVDVSNDMPADLDLRLYDSGCTQIDSTTGDSLSWTNVTAAQETVIVEIYVGPDPSSCASYDLSVTTMPDPCFSGPDDGLEENDSCVFSVQLGAGSYPGLYASVADPDFYRITVPAGEVLEFSFVGDESPADLDLRLYDEFCTQIGAFNTDGLEWTNTTGASTAVVVEVHVDQFDADTCSLYDATVTLTPDPCIVAADDGLEDNDTCAAATPLGVGSYPGLFCSQTDADFYRITIPPGDELTVSWVNDLPADLEARLFDDACALLAELVGDQVQWSNLGAASIDVIAEIYVNPFAVDTCANYDLTVALAPDPCFGTPDDSFENNDACATAKSIGNGTFPGLFLSKFDRDYYSLAVADGATLTVDALFSHASGDMDIFLYDGLGTCENGEGIQHNCDSAVVCGFSASDNESLAWTNTSGAARTYLLEVSLWPPTPSNCNTYDLVISGVSHVPIGSNYCDPAVANSTGVAGVMSASGSVIAAANDVTLTATDLPTGQFAYFIGSQAQGFTPNAGGSQGHLCLANPAARWSAQVSVVSAGMVSLLIDTQNAPLPPNFAHAITSGETWSFQCWYRDANPFATSNFTNGLMIAFQ